MTVPFPRCWTCGDRKELGDVGESPRKSCLFFLTSSPHHDGLTAKTDYPELRSTGWKSGTRFVSSGALSTTLENPRDSMIFTPGRTDNRIRSPR